MKINKFAYSIPALVLLMTSSNATSLKDIVEHTIKDNQDIVSKSLNNEAFRKYIDEQKGGYYPKLDLTAYLERKRTKENFETLPDTDDTLNGGNVQLDFEQLIYDGNLTPQKVEEAKASYISNKFKNSNDVETILLDSVTSYLDMVKYNERISISENNLKIHEEYLSIAKETEAINGEILDKVQTKAKIHNAKSRLFDEINSQSTAKSSFLKNVSMDIKGNICRPNIDENKIPSTLISLQESALKSNFEVLSQIEKIKQQRAVISQNKASFLPTLKFKLQGVYDNDLIKDNAETKIYSGKLELKYNIFNGLTDRNKTQREELFLREAQAKLDVVAKSVTDNVSVAYNTYNTAKKQIIELEQFIEENKQIIDIYNDQFDAGTRNFIDVLNVEADLYNSKINLINTEYIMYQSYYEILKNTSSLQTTILNSQNQICSVSVSEPMIEKEKNTETIDSLLKEDDVTMIESTSTSKYALFIESYTNEASANKTEDLINAKLENEFKTKVIRNNNGSYTVAVYDIPTKANTVAIKNKLDYNYPNSYFIKKKN